MPDISIKSFKQDPQLNHEVPEEVAKALLVWFEAPHALAIEDVCNLYDWFHMPMCAIKWGTPKRQS